jgi:glutamine amidotransferase
MNNLKICILDYGSGNVGSAFNILSVLTERVVVSNRAEDIMSASHLVLPGVGAFGAAMKKINEKLPVKLLKEEVLSKGKPFLGICVGMQVLADKGFEFGECQGLGWIAGQVKALDSHGLTLPHIGWNNIEIKNQIPLLDRLGEKPDFYFLHSFVFNVGDNANIAARAEYGDKFNAVIFKDNIFGVQFHPEKSQKAGKILLQNFINLR